MAQPHLADERSGARTAIEWIAIGLHVVVALPYAFSGLLAPPAGVAVLGVIWLVLFVALWRWRPRPAWRALLIPVAAVALWLAVLAFGDALLGWTA